MGLNNVKKGEKKAWTALKSGEKKSRKYRILRESSYTSALNGYKVLVVNGISSV